MSPRTAKQPDCDVCAKPATPLSFGMCHNCYNVWARAGRPHLRLWGRRRRKWLREHSTLKCSVCDSLTTVTYLGMDMACYRAWVTAGRPDWTSGPWTGAEAQAPSGVPCLPQGHRGGVFRHGLQLLQGVVLGWASRPGQLGCDTTGVARPKSATAVRKGRPQVRNEHLNEEGLVENARRPGTGGPSCIDN